MNQAKNENDVNPQGMEESNDTDGYFSDDGGLDDILDENNEGSLLHCLNSIVNFFKCFIVINVHMCMFSSGVVVLGFMIFNCSCNN